MSEASNGIELWRREALCHTAPDEDKRIFLPWGVRHGTVTQKDLNRIKNTYCARCPVRDECLNFGAETESLGVWGGFNFTWNRSRKIHKLQAREGWLTLERVKEYFSNEPPEDDT